MDLFKAKAQQFLPSSIYGKLRYLKHAWWDGFSMRTYSQTGEDVILRQRYLTKRNGFYVDVGAHHPKRFSNTHFFYQRGWRGINIDAMPGSMNPFRTNRPRDINLEMGVGAQTDKLTFHVFEEPALNTFNPEQAQLKQHEGAKKIREVLVGIAPLSKIFEEHLPKNITIDFLSIDVEGLDLVVLQSNDWQRFRPDHVIVECDGFDLDQPDSNKIYKFMKGKGYSLFAKTIASVFFVRQS